MVSVCSALNTTKPWARSLSTLNSPESTLLNEHCIQDVSGMLVNKSLNHFELGFPDIPDYSKVVTNSTNVIRPPPNLSHN